MTNPSTRIASAFARINADNSLTQADRDAFEKHRAGIQASISSAFEISKFEVIGSYARDSTLRGSSDLDLFTVVRKKEIERGGSIVSPLTLMNRVRTALQSTFPRTEIGRDGQAVVVEFRDGKSVDVVPAWWVRPMDNGWPVYRIPGSSSDWIDTSP
jgi:tRNA nucleotidyltransferase (CCA-adding enzyme)